MSPDRGSRGILTRINQKNCMKGRSPRKKFEKEFIDYAYKGAFPELVRETDEKIARKYINELVVRKINWRDKNKNEVDTVSKIGKKLVPPETDYRGLVTPSDTRALSKFMEKFGVTRMAVITKDTFKEKNR